MESKSISIEWTIFWIVVHSVSVFLTSLLLASVSDIIIFTIGSGLGISIIAKSVRTVIRHSSFRIDGNFLYWIIITTIAFWICRSLLLFAGVSNGLGYFLLTGAGIFFLSRVFQTIFPLSKKKSPGKIPNHHTKPSSFKKHIPDISFPKSSHDSYLIEIRIIDRNLKFKIKGLEDEIVNKFGIGEHHFVPHISLAGGLSTSSETQLISVFTDLCSKTPVMKFQIKGFSAFEEPKRVIYFDINPCENLKKFRFDLSQRLKSFCKLKQFDFYGKEEFVFHSTLALNVPEPKFKKIQEYVKHEHYDSSDYCISRITLVKNSRILVEYDFFQKRLLTREEAKDPHQYRLTEDLAKKYSCTASGLTNVSIPRFEMESSFFLISDTHFDHKNIIEYCNRPFSNLNQMNHTILNNWNSVVKNHETVFFLGDMSWGKKHRPISYWLAQLNGTIQFIIGPSHDEPRPPDSYDSVIVNYRNRDFLLVHNPHDPDRIPKDWSDWIIHGHKHNNSPGKYPFINGENKTINVSVELTGYKPVNIDQILALDLDSIQRMQTIESQPIRK